MNTPTKMTGSQQQKGRLVTTPTPVDLQRVHEYLGMCVTSTAEDLIVVDYPSAVVTVDVRDLDVLNVMGLWRAVASSQAQMAVLYQAVLNCNRQRTAPKAFLLPVPEQNECGLAVSVPLIVAGGATDDQLNEFREWAVTSIFDFFAEVEAQLPELVHWRDEK